jgi:hypothetical protein
MGRLYSSRGTSAGEIEIETMQLKLSGCNATEESL